MNMCEGNLKPKIKAMMVSLEDKSLAKLREAALRVENVHKELVRPAWPGSLTRRSDIDLSIKENPDIHKQI